METTGIRVRFAPSPTGPLHLGGVRTALYNYLFARKNNGKFILRIEDTDQNRFVPGAEDYIIKSLQWCGLEFDEGVIQGGPYAPYRQSERSDIYKDYIQVLLDKGHAYMAFDTAEELEDARNKLPQSHEQFQYGINTRMQMKNSLSLPADEIRSRIERGDRYVIRILIPENQTVHFHDLIRGEVNVLTDALDDKVLFKSDGLPTYHLANVVDDYLMKITHVIRGEEWLPSAPLHLLLYRFFGWEGSMPQFAHLPLILKPDGNGKLSKRDGDRLGFPVFPMEWNDPGTLEISHGYKEDGYLPDAFINMLALLGWNPGTEQEIFAIDELVSAFSLDRINKSGAKFDPLKARWFNHKYVQLKSDTELYSYLGPILIKNCITADSEYVLKVIALIKERVELLPDLWKNSSLFFRAPEAYDKQVKQKIWQEGTSSLLEEFAAIVSSLKIFDKDNLHSIVEDFIVKKKIKTGKLMNPLRLLVVGSNQGPGMMDIAVMLGKEEFLRRIFNGIKNI
ncbi:MAG: glutamate--tRNA ligase [Bacteroidetes bacterium]|nr:glutamate--tRNA ligase [Bacteroidota bacterium]